MYVITDDIKNRNLKQVYLLTGEEDYLINQFREKLLKALTGKETVKELQGDMNFSCFSGKNIELEKVFDLARTQPFFAERRVILLRNMGFKAEDAEKFVDFLKEIPEFTYFILEERALEKNARIYRGCEKYGHVADLQEQNEDRIRQWLIGLVKKEGKNITNGAMNELLMRSGFDMMLLNREINKLLVYCMDKEAIEKEDVEALITPTVSNHVYQMIDAVGNKNRQRALSLYYELLEMKYPPTEILGKLGRQFSNLCAAKELRQKGYGREAVADKMKVKPFVADKFLKQAGKFTLEQLKEAIDDCIDYDRKLKTGNMDKQMCIELLLIKYSS